MRVILLASLLGIALWQGLVMALDMPPFILPGPALTFERIWLSRALLLEHSLVTLTEVGAGIILGVLLGALTAITLAALPRLARIVQPLLVFGQAIPVFALAPILTLWFGYGMGSKISMALIIIYFPVLSAFFDGLTGTPRPWLDLAHSLGGSPWRILWRVRVPAALPNLASGIRLAAVYAPLGAIIGEWVGASKGLGYLMLLAMGRSKTDLMFAALIILALMTVALHKLIDHALDRPPFRPW